MRPAQGRIRRNDLAFEVCKRGDGWTAVVVCDVCGDDIQSGGNLCWSWEAIDDKKYHFALPVVMHDRCSRIGAMSSIVVGGGKTIKMDLMDYISLLLLNYPLSPALSPVKSKRQNDA